MTTIPTIDLRDLSAGAERGAASLEDLRRTVGTIGAFYLVGHGVPAAAGDRLFALSRRFFGLPERERRSIGAIGIRLSSRWVASQCRRIRLSTIATS